MRKLPASARSSECPILDETRDGRRRQVRRRTCTAILAALPIGIFRANPENLGPVLADGGFPVEGIARILGGEKWAELAKAHLLTEGD